MFHDFAYRLQESVPNKSASNEFVRKRALSFFIWYSKSALFDQIPFISENEAGKCQICGKQILQANGKVYFEACNILPTDVVPARYKQSISEGWNSLCLCPNCAAEFKFGKKNLSGLISMIQNYHVKERDENLIVCDIEMQGEKRSIKYTGKHFLALQRAVSFYETDMNSSTK